MSKRLSKNQRYLLLSACMVLVCVLSYVIPQESITAEFYDAQFLKGWKVLYNPDRTVKQLTKHGLKLTTQYESYIVSPVQPDDFTWERYPFVVVDVEPTNEERSLTLIWFFMGADVYEFYSRPNSLKPGQSRIVFNSQDNQLHNFIDSWDSEFLNGDKIVQFGLKFSQSITIKSVTLTNTWPLKELVREWGYSIFQRDNPIHAYSINLEKGPKIASFWLISSLGILLVFSALFYLIERRIVIFTATLCLSLLLFDINLMLNLIRFAKYSSEVSAFHEDEYTEFKSRFGSEFADFNVMLRNTLPAQAKVRFIESNAQSQVRGESNWIKVLYTGVYNVIADQPDYLALFHPKGIENPPYKVNNKLYLKIDSTVYQIQPIKKLSDQSMLLKVIHD